MSFVHYLHEYFRHVGRNPEENGTLAITGICTLSMPHAPPVQIDDWTIWQTLTILRKALERFRVRPQCYTGCACPAHFLIKTGITLAMRVKILICVLPNGSND